MIPTFTEKKMPTDTERVYKFHNDITQLAKSAINDLHTQEIEGLLQNFSLLMAGDYGESETVEFPVEVVRETALFASVCLSRLLWERYKLEKRLGRSLVDREPNTPDLTNLIFGDKLEKEEKE